MKDIEVTEEDVEHVGGFGDQKGMKEPLEIEEKAAGLA